MRPVLEEPTSLRIDEVSVPARFTKAAQFQSRLDLSYQSAQRSTPWLGFTRPRGGRNRALLPETQRVYPWNGCLLLQPGQRQPDHPIIE